MPVQLLQCAKGLPPIQESGRPPKSQYPPPPDPPDPCEPPEPDEPELEEPLPPCCPDDPDPFFLVDMEYESSLPPVPFPVVSVVPSPWLFLCPVMACPVVEPPCPDAAPPLCPDPPVWAVASSIIPPIRPATRRADAAFFNVWISFMSAPSCACSKIAVLAWYASRKSLPFVYARSIRMCLFDSAGGGEADFGMQS